MKTNIALIGFMGTGKTVVGKVLAERLVREFVELDLLIEQKAGKSIPDIFRQDGEIAFRELEIEATRDMAGGKNLVIACGGGIVLNKINVDRLRENARMVYLIASPKVILKRLSSEVGQRPLLEVDNPAQTVREMLMARRPFYEGAADMRVDTSGLDIEAVAERIVERLREDEGFGF